MLKLSYTNTENIEALEERISEIEAAMQENGSDFTRLSQLQQELDEQNEKLLKKYERYEYLSGLEQKSISVYFCGNI